MYYLLSVVANIQEITPHMSYYSADGTQMWIPSVPDNEKPQCGAIFENWEEVVKMYEAYAAKSGFDIRFSTLARTKGMITHRYIVCNREGKPRPKNVDTMDTASTSSNKRNSNQKVTRCKACIKLRAVPGTTAFVLYKFNEHHNHGLVSIENMDLSRRRRQLRFTDQKHIHQLNTTGFGATIAHRMQTTLKGGHHNVRGSKTDYKNFSRDIKCFIGDRDAEMLKLMMEGHVKHLENFSYESVEFNHELTALFWADDVCKCNYSVFGDVLAFDATFDTNKYKMTFVPFTGVDHHKRCVTFGAGLIHNETIDSYKWLLECFLKAHGKQPILILTDQDPAMKQAIAAVFTESKHRLCMWHVIQKLPTKVCGDLLKNTDLRARIHKLVWNVFIKPSTFEERWNDLISEFNLKENGWLDNMFNIRDQWVPGYFRDIPLCCLMKTTSRCESSNSFFKVYSTPGNTLIQFMIAYETALNAQRYNQRVAEFASTTTRPTLKTGLAIELHASHIYTTTIFDEVQKEIEKSLYYCFRDRCERDGDLEISVISHNNKKNGFVGEFKVTMNLSDTTVTCSCMGYTRIGYLCRHIFCAFRKHNIDNIPDHYICKRWRKDALPSTVYSLEKRYGVATDENSKLREEATSLFEACVDRLRGDTERLSIFVEEQRKLKNKIYEEVPIEPSYNSKKAVIADLIGQPQPETISVNVPKGIRNKGCGTSRRLRGPGEKAVERSKKPKRLCKLCKQYSGHDTRNCPTKKSSADAPTNSKS